MAASQTMHQEHNMVTALPGSRTIIVQDEKIVIIES
jgi:hypothetical protein